MKKIFMHKQLSLYFKIALLINTIGLFLNLIVYHYFAQNNILRMTAENLSTLSLFIISLIIISQLRSIFIQNHKTFIRRYKVAALNIEIFLGVLCLWILKIDNDIEDKVIIFISSLSKFDHSYWLILILIAIAKLLILDFYKTLKTLDDAGKVSASQFLRSTFLLVLKKYFLISICVFRFAHFKKIYTLGIALLNYSKSCLFYHLKILVIILPITWTGAIAYFLYQQYQQKKQLK